MRIKIALVKFWAWSALILTLGLVFGLFAMIFIKGVPVINWTFLSDIPRGAVIGTKGGIYPAILGSLYYTGIACVFGAILGIGCALYQAIWCQSPRVNYVIDLVMTCMAGTPSIVMGLFGYSLLVLAFGWGKCLLAGGITQGIMILPFIEVRAVKTFREADRALINASLSLGVSRSWTVRKLLLPTCLSQLVSAVILGACYAIGAAAPLIFTGAVIMARAPKSLMKPAMALPYHLYMLLTQGTSEAHAYGTAFVMMLLVLTGSCVSLALAHRANKNNR